MVRLSLDDEVEQSLGGEDGEGGDDQQDVSQDTQHGVVCPGGP